MKFIIFLSFSMLQKIIERCIMRPQLTSDADVSSVRALVRKHKLWKEYILRKAYPDEERLPVTVGISHPICQLKRKRKHRVR